MFHLQWYMNFVAQVFLASFFKAARAVTPLQMNTLPQLWTYTWCIHTSPHVTSFIRPPLLLVMQATKARLKAKVQDWKKIILLGPTMFMLCVTDSVVRFFLPIIMACELQIWMSVLVAFMDAIYMQHATILKGVTPALVTVDTQAMDLPAQV